MKITLEKKIGKIKQHTNLEQGIQNANEVHFNIHILHILFHTALQQYCIKFCHFKGLLLIIQLTSITHDTMEKIIPMLRVSYAKILQSPKILVDFPIGLRILTADMKMICHPDNQVSNACHVNGTIRLSNYVNLKSDQMYVDYVYFYMYWYVLCSRNIVILACFCTKQFNGKKKTFTNVCHVKLLLVGLWHRGLRAIWG